MTRPNLSIEQEIHIEQRLDCVERALVKMHGVEAFLDDPERPATHRMAVMLRAEIERERHALRRELGLI